MAVLPCRSCLYELAKGDCLSKLFADCVWSLCAGFARIAFSMHRCTCKLVRVIRVRASRCASLHQVLHALGLSEWRLGPGQRLGPLVGVGPTECQQPAHLRALVGGVRALVPGVPGRSLPPQFRAAAVQVVPECSDGLRLALWLKTGTCAMLARKMHTPCQLADKW